MSEKGCSFRSCGSRVALLVSTAPPGCEDLDVFDVGQLRRRTWDTTQPGVPGDDLGLGATIVLQEQCNWGGDLDADGFDDPIFLWNSETRELAIRLFVVNETVEGLPIVRRVEALAYLRNPQP